MTRRPVIISPCGPEAQVVQIYAVRPPTIWLAGRQKYLIENIDGRKAEIQWTGLYDL